MPQLDDKRNKFIAAIALQIMSLISKDYYSTREFATLQGVHIKSVHRWVQKGQAPTHELFAGSYWFEKAAVAAWSPPVLGPKKKSSKQRR